jgi:hypothetical protein
MIRPKFTIRIPQPPSSRRSHRGWSGRRRGELRDAWKPYPTTKAPQEKIGASGGGRGRAVENCAGRAEGDSRPDVQAAAQPLRWRIRARMRRFFWPSLRLPLPVFLTPMLVSTA